MDDEYDSVDMMKEPGQRPAEPAAFGGELHEDLGSWK
jgi:hypothetical protein